MVLLLFIFLRNDCRNVVVRFLDLQTSEGLTIGHEHFNIYQKIRIQFQCHIFQNNLFDCESPLSSIAAKLQKQPKIAAWMSSLTQ